MDIRLLNTTTGRFHVADDPREVHYAILSHVWARPPDLRDPELTYQDVLRIHDTHTPEQNPSNPHQVVSYIPQFPEKIRKFCDIAREHGYDYAWADACCIDKTSSSELSQAINAMYDWYRYADVCYVFLHDVPTPSTPSTALDTHRSRFRTSVWFKRGWTLQELLAPDVVVFLSEVWEVIGTKHTLAALIEEITTIPRDVLTGRRALEDVSVACRMSWASSRKTTHEEDRAYSLLGIFGVTLRTTYGEGSYAFIRLQQEILKQIPDQTIFAWGSALSTEMSPFRLNFPTEWAAPNPQPIASLETSPMDQYLLASSPEAFKDSSHIVSIPWDTFLRRFGEPLSHRPTYTTTPYGIRAHLPLLATRIENAQTAVPTCVVLLACRDSRSSDYMALLLRSQPQRESDFFVGALVGNLHDIFGLANNGVNSNLAASTTAAHYYYRLTPFPEQFLTSNLQRFEWKDIHIPHWPSLAAYNLERDHLLHSSLPRTAHGDRFQLSVSKWSHHVLKLKGYSIAENWYVSAAVRQIFDSELTIA